MLRGRPAYNLQGVMPPNVNVGALAVVINLEKGSRTMSILIALLIITNVKTSAHSPLLNLDELLVFLCN